MNGPLPSTRAFLSDVPSLPADSKVRFLGWASYSVKTYQISTGHLVLEHNYPRLKKPREDPPSITIDVNAILEAMTWEELCVGAWINVIGYVRKAPVVAWDKEVVSAPASSSMPESVHVDAVIVFPAGAIDLGEYEQILNDSQEVERMRRAVE